MKHGAISTFMKDHQGVDLNMKHQRQKRFVHPSWIAGLRCNICQGCKSLVMQWDEHVIKFVMARWPSLTVTASGFIAAPCQTRICKFIYSFCPFSSFWLTGVSAVQIKYKIFKSVNSGYVLTCLIDWFRLIYLFSNAIWGWDQHKPFMLDFSAKCNRTCKLTQKNL